MFLTEHQDTVPARFSCLEIHSAAQLATSAFLASPATSLDLINHIMPARLPSLPKPYMDITWLHDLMNMTVLPFGCCGLLNRMTPPKSDTLLQSPPGYLST